MTADNLLVCSQKRRSRDLPHNESTSPEPWNSGAQKSIGQNTVKKKKDKKKIIALENQFQRAEQARTHQNEGNKIKMQGLDSPVDPTGYLKA